MGDQLKREDGVLVSSMEADNGKVELRAYELDGMVKEFRWLHTSADGWWLERYSGRVVGTRAELAALAKAFPPRPEDYPCPSCGAVVGEKCTLKDGTKPIGNSWHPSRTSQENTQSAPQGRR